MRKILSRFAELRARTPQDEPPFQHIPRSEDSSLSPAHPTSGQLHGILMPDTRDRDLGSQKSSALKHGNGNGAGTVVYGREGGDIDQLVTVLPYANQGVSRRDLDRTGGREIDADSAYPEDQEGGDPPFAKPEPVFGALGDSKNREGNGSGKWDVYGSDLEDSACLRPGDIPATCFDVPFTSFAAAGLEYNTDFHKVFPNVPKDDRVLKVYECRLDEWEVLIGGTLYLSEKHMCFNAEIYGLNSIIPLPEVTGLEKAMTTLGPPDAIKISTCTSCYTFTFFCPRDAAYDVIHNIWQLSRPGREPIRKPTQCECGKEGEHVGTPLMNSVVPGTPKAIFNLMFTSTFLKGFMEERYSDIRVMSNGLPDSQLLTRNMIYIGPGHTKYELKDEILRVDFDDYVSILTTIRTPDVPNGNAFVVKTKTCITWASAAASRLIVMTAVEWRSPTEVESITEKSTIDDRKQYYIEFENAMRSYISAHRAEFVPDGVTEDPDALSWLRPIPNGSIGPQDELHTPKYTATIMFELLIQHGCLDLTPLIDPLGFSSSAVAEGGFGDVWTGRLHNDGTKLAIKVLRFTSSTGDSARKELKRTTREIYNWSKLEHEHVNKLMGVIMFRERLGMVSKWMEHGNLRQYLSRNSGVDRYELCVQIARGVAYLHDVNMIHGDLKACNILVSSAGVLKITDFDYSIFPECALAFSATTRIGGGTRRWMAPELLMNEKPPQRNKTTDIYALGMTFLETMTNAHPYSECSHDTQILLKHMRKEHPIRPTQHFPGIGWSDRMWSLLLRCWDCDPASRPIAKDVLESLLTLKKENADTP